MPWLDGDPEAEAERERYRQSQPNGEAGQEYAPRFRPVRFKDISLSADRPYLVEGLIPREGLTVVWGPPKCGKSYWTFDVAMHVALGRDYRGRKVTQGIVVYVACEGERGLAARVEAFRQARLTESDDPPFFLLTTRLDLVADIEQLVADIEQLVADIRAAIGADHCAAVVVNTLNRSIAGSESRDDDMGAYVKATDRLREAFAAAIIIIHHCGINEARPRGHTSLTGAADAQIAVKRDNSDRIIATVEYMKDGAEGGVIASRLAVVKIGTDEDGEPITSCVIEPAEGAATAENQPKLSGIAKVAFDQLLNCMADQAEDLPPSNHAPNGIKGITLKAWRAYLEKAGIVNAEGNPREQFRRIRVTLQERGFIGVWEDFAWPSQPSHRVTSASQ